MTLPALSTYLAQPAVLAAAAGFLVLFVLLLWATTALARRGADLQALRLLIEQTLAGQRSEGETTRLALASAIQRGTAETTDRLGALSDKHAALGGAFDTGIETIRTVLTRSQGDLRLALAEGLEKSTQHIATQFESTRLLLETKLREMREGNEGKLAEIQKTVNEQLHDAVEKQMTASFARVVDQFAAVQKAMGDVQAVTAQIGDIKRLFTNVKTRGGWGEAQVRAMLDDILPPGAYETNRKLRADSDDAVEFAVAMPGRSESTVWLPIDAKFPVEDYERLLSASETGDVEGERLARRGLERRVRDEAKKIQAKYINPPVTVEFAVLYVPTDALYAEIARIPGMIDEIGRVHRVLILGPSVFPALLRTIHLGHVTLTLETKAEEIRTLLGATRQEMVKMDGVLDKLAKQAGVFSNTIERARTRTRAVGRRLRGVEMLDPGRTELVLELEADANGEEETIEE